MRQPLSCFLTALFAVFSTTAVGASFDCERAQTSTEKQICSTASLSVMDEVIATLYRQARQTSAEEASEEKQAQRQWLKERDQICEQGPVQKCEQVFIDRIQTLLEQVREPVPAHPAVTSLLTGMSVPKLTDLDPYSREKAEVLGPDIYTPWPRKQIAELNIVSVPAVAVADGTPYLYLVFYSKAHKASCLYEQNLLTGAEVIGSCEVGRKIGVKGDQVLVSQYWRNGDGYYRFAVGTLADAQLTAVAAQDEPTFFANRMREQALWMASDDGNRLAVVARHVFDEGLENEMPYAQSLQLDRMRALTDPQQLEDARPLVIYDRNHDSVTLSPELLPEEDDYYWESIFGIRWKSDSQSVFFDNEGSRMACIWEFEPDSRKLYKIVPEADAINPYPFTLHGHDFIVYSKDNQIMLAARPAGR